jgi:hypothetical protein
MKVLLLGVNASWTHSCLALYYLRNTLRNLSIPTRIIELTLKQSVSEALEVICSDHPDVLCLSVYIWNVEYIKTLVRDLRKLMPKLIIVAGGPEISYNEATQDAVNPDYLVIGAGEAAFRALAESGFRSKAQVIAAERIPLEQILYPYQTEDKESLQGRMVYYEASRGCACKCSYCLSSRDEIWEWLPVERVCRDIDQLLSLQPKVIKFVDRSFNSRKEWARTIWQYVVKLDTDIPFHFEIYPDWLETEDVQILSQAPRGRIQLEIGIQSVHQDTQNKINRQSEWQKVRTTLNALRECTQIPLHTDLIVGLPGENTEQIRKSVNEVLSTYPNELQLGFLKILSGTPMYNYAKENHYIWSGTAPYNILQTPDLSFTVIVYMEKIALIINQYWNKGEFKTVWDKAVEWREPFECFGQLLQLSLAGDKTLHSIDRINRFNLMARWIEMFFAGEQRSYLTDALKWDWCRKAGEVWYPDFLKGEQAVLFRKEHYNEILDWLKSEYWQNENWNLKRFTVFSATSDEFCREYLEGYTKAIFISVKAGDNAVVIYRKRF